MSLPPGWIQLQDPMGRTYYANTLTQESQFEPPTLPATSAEPTADMLRAEFKAILSKEMSSLREELVELMAADDKDPNEISITDLADEIKGLRVKVTRLEALAGVLSHEDDEKPKQTISHAATVPNLAGDELLRAVSGKKPLQKHIEPEEEVDDGKPSWMKEAAKKKALKDQREAEERARVEAEAKAKARAEKIAALEKGGKGGGEGAGTPAWMAKARAKAGE